MTENNLRDPITNLEMAFAHLILSGTMTDRQAAEAVGLNPDSAGYTKSEPRIRDYMLGHRAAEQQQGEQDTQGLRQFNVGRDKVLTRLWEIANMGPERTRNSMSAQVKAISMIVAIEGLIPDRHSVSQNQPAQPPVHPGFYRAAWMRNPQNAESMDPEPHPAQDQTQEEGPAPELQSAPRQADEPHPAVSAPTPNPTPNLAESAFSVRPLNPSQTTSSAPRIPMADYFAPDTRAPFSLDKNRFRNDNRFGRRA
jgi:hypothetical protein